MRVYAAFTVGFGIVLALHIQMEASARVSGVCSNCHTMHNLQGGTAMKLDSTPDAGVADNPECRDCHADTRSVLLRLDCLGCHAESPNGGDNIIALTGAPQVAHNAANDLAGGNFRHLLANDDTYGHNVHGFGAILSADANLGNTPPGYNASFDPSSGKYQTAYPAGQVMCAGQNGCHGDRDEVGQLASIYGAHHQNDSALQFGAGFSEAGQGATVGASYRYLYKVKGAEDADWQDTTSGTDHNEYRGTTFDSGRATQAWNNIQTMSQFCSECHGNFHSGAGLGGADPWIRHPSDAILPNSAPFTDYTTYDTGIPVARQSITAGSTQASSSVTPGTDIVFCLSCHRAHGSAYPDSLRWDYSTCQTNTADANCGCFTCHADKDDP